MTAARIKSPIEQKMVSPRACVALSALGAVRHTIAFLRRVFAPRPPAVTNLVLHKKKSDQFCEPFALIRHKELTSEPNLKKNANAVEISRSGGQ
jgi:hypothetical protein